MLKNREIASIRHAYAKKELRKSSVNKNPIEQLTLWLKEAIDTQIIEPNAMILSTVGDYSEPSSRVVLLKEFTIIDFNSSQTIYPPRQKIWKTIPPHRFFFSGGKWGDK